MSDAKPTTPDDMRGAAKELIQTAEEGTDPVVIAITGLASAVLGVGAEICERLNTLIEQNRLWSESWAKNARPAKTDDGSLL